MPSQERQIQANRRRYRRLARSYERRHGEIFNSVEQRRLRETLSRSLGLVDTGTPQAQVLDYGCGTGNVTSHLLSLGARVTAADLSPVFLEMVLQRHGATERLRALQLNGRDLDGVPSESFDMAVVYSVLHHIPDYLTAVTELCRVLRPGGVLMIDHEASPDAWTPKPALLEYWAAAAQADTPDSWGRFFNGSYLAGQTQHLYTQLRRRIGDPRFFPEGDLHVWPDDHIDWDRIEWVTAERGLERVACEDYLLHRRNVDEAVYDRHSRLAADTRTFIARRLRPEPGAVRR